MMSFLVRAMIVFVAGVLAAGAAWAQDDGFRCGSVIVSVGMSADDVLQSCGPPTSKTVEQVVKREGVQYTGYTPVEHWTYASDTITRVLTFDQGKLVSIDQQ